MVDEGNATTQDDTIVVGEAATSAPAVGVGDRVGRYELTKVLGTGGMGVVYRARDHELSRDVAVKVLRHDRRDPGNDASQRLLREARALAALAHPNVIDVYDVGTVGRSVFFAMELFDGDNLRDRIAAKPSVDQIYRWFFAAAAGLQAAHDGGVVHRDFKPANVLVASDGRVAVTDFGIAVATGEVGAQFSHDESSVPSSMDGESLTRTGTVMGTPGYMAPEQHFAAAATARADQFAFCVALWEALFGERPYAGKDVAETRANTADGKIRMPRSPRAPRAVIAALVRGLAPEADERWPSMAALVDALEHARSGRWRWGRVAGVAAVGGVIAVGQFVPAPTETEACARLSALELPDTEAAAAAFAKVGSDGAAAWTVARPRLDGWATEWADMRSLACLDHGRQGAAELDAQAACLEAALTEYRTVVEVFQSADARLVDRANHAISGLPHLEGCRDSDYVGLPDDPARAQALREARRDLATAHALDLTGRYAQARPLADSALRLAEEGGGSWETAQARYYIGRLSESTGEYELAAQQLERAAWTGLEEGHDLWAGKAMAELVFVLGARLGRFEEALEWGRRATPVMERLGDRSPVPAWLSSNIAISLAMAGQVEEAAARFERTIALQTDILGPLSSDLAGTRINYGVALRKLGRIEDARAQYAIAATTLETVEGRTHPETAMAYAALGQATAQLGNLTEARAYLQQSYDVFETALGPEHATTLSIRNSLGALEHEAGKYDLAQQHYEAALEVAQNTLGTNVVTAELLCNLADNHLEQGDLDAANLRFLEAETMASDIGGEDTPDRSCALRGLAATAQHRGELELAESRLREAVAITGGRGGEGDAIDFVRSLHELGEVLIAREQWTEAEQMLVAAQEAADGIDVHSSILKRIDASLQRARESGV